MLIQNSYSRMRMQKPYCFKDLTDHLVLFFFFFFKRNCVEMLDFNHTKCYVILCALKHHVLH